MPARLNRRRYKEATAALKQIISDAKQPAQRRLIAVQTLLSIFDRHDQSEDRRMRREAAAQTVPDTQETSEPVTESPVTDDAEHAAKMFLESLTTMEDENE